MELLKRAILILFLMNLLSMTASAANQASGILPTNSSCTSWEGSCSNVPANLNRTTDGNFSNVTGYGYSNQNAIDNAYIQIDLGSIKTISYIRFKAEAINFDVITGALTIEVSQDATAWTTLAIYTYSALVTIDSNISVNTPIRYIRSSAYYTVGNGAPDDVRVRFYEIWVDDAPLLLTPENTSTAYYIYPPQTSNINFTWLSTSQLSYNLQVAKDSNFNLISVDTVVSTNYSVQSLQGTQQYWWKVRTYNSTSGAYGGWSDTFNFTLQANNTVANSSVQGVVYELINNAQTAVSGASVFWYNATASGTQVTGSNGYYLFQNMGNGTYNLQASKTDYQSSALQTVNVSGNVVTQDILIEKCISGFNCFYNQGYVKFVVQNWFGTVKYAGVTTSVYRGSDVTTTYTGITGTDGTVTFLLKKDQQYRITFIDASQGISESITLVPSDSLYYIIVSDTAVPWWNGTYSETQQIVTTASTHVINTTHAHVNLTYNDSLGQTTALVFYLNQTNHSGINNTQIILQSFSAGAQGNYTQSFIVSGYSGQSYLVNVRATHTTFGTVYRSYGVQFPGLQTNADNFIPTKMKAIIALAFMFFIGAVFGEIRAAQGAGIFCILGWIFLGMGWLAYFNSITMGAGLAIGTVLAVMWNMNERKKAEGLV